MSLKKILPLETLHLDIYRTTQYTLVKLYYTNLGNKIEFLNKVIS